MCVSPDENRNNAVSENSNNCSSDLPTVSSDSGEVYVWGSNSSHQLAEGNQEKILQPKQATMFTAVQQVGIGSVVDI